MILVTGATGNVGAELVAERNEDDEPVRAMTRRPRAVRFPAGVEVVYGDFDDPASIDAAFRDVDRAFLMSAQMPGSERRPTHDLRLVEAARRAGVGRVAKLSVFDGGAGDNPIGEWHRQAEAAVVESGMDWTLLRPGRFMSNALQWARRHRRRGGRRPHRGGAPQRRPPALRAGGAHARGRAAHPRRDPRSAS